MGHRRLGAVFGAVAALVVIATGASPHTIGAARAAEGDTTTIPTTIPPTTRATQPPPTDPPPTQPDISTEPTPTTKKSNRTTTTTRRSAGATATTRRTDTTEAAAEITDTTTVPDETTITEAPSTTQRTAARVALPADEDKKSQMPILALVLGALGLGGLIFAGVRRSRSARVAYEPAEFQTLSLPPMFGDDEPVAEVDPEPAPQTDWAPLWEPGDAATESAAAQAAAVESQRARRKRERRERFHSEHDSPADTYDEPVEADAALDEPVAAPRPAPPAPPVMSSPFDDLDLSGPAPVDPGIPDMQIDLSDPEF